MKSSVDNMKSDEHLSNHPPSYHRVDSPSQLWTATGKPDLWRVVTNCLSASWTGTDDWRPCRNIFCRPGNTSATLCPASSSRVAAIRDVILRDRYRFFRAVNGLKSSTHWAVSISPGQRSGEDEVSSTWRCSNVEW